MWGYKLSTAIFLFTFSISAQITYQGPADGSVSTGVSLNTNNFLNSSEAVQSFKFNKLFNVFEYEGEPEILNWGDSINLKTEYFDLISRTDNISDSSIIFNNFEGIPQTNEIPPDDYIAAGPENIMMVVNSKFRIYDKNGNVLKTISADSWYNNLIPGIAPFDPKVIYDHISMRWVMDG